MNRFTNPNPQNEIVLYQPDTETPEAQNEGKQS